MKAVLFDMDGVLVDVSLSYRLTVQRVAEFFSHQAIPPSLIHDYKNRGGLNNDWDLTEAILKDKGIEVEKREIIGAFQKIYMGADFDGLIKNEKWMLSSSILERMIADFHLGIVTGRPRKEAQYTLQRFGREKYFSVLVARDDLPPGKDKPDPCGIEMALKTLKTREACYVGDVVDDMIAAKRARVIPIGLIIQGVNEEKQRDLLLKSGAQYVLRDINHLLEVLK